MTTGKDKPLHNDLHRLRTILESIKALLEERLIGIEEPLPDETKTIREYEDNKKKGKTELVGLNDFLGRNIDGIHCQHYQ